MATKEVWIADLLNENNANADDINLHDIISDYFGDRKDDLSSDDDEGMFFSLCLCFLSI